MTPDRQQSAPVPVPDPLGFAEAATGGAVRDVFRIAAGDTAELAQQSTETTITESTTNPDTEPERADSEPSQHRESQSGREQVRRQTGKTVETIL